LRQRFYAIHWQRSRGKYKINSLKNNALIQINFAYLRAVKNSLAQITRRDYFSFPDGDFGSMPQEWQAIR